MPEDRSAEADSPRRAAFIVGPPRSGTSLLRALLDDHPELMVLPRETFAAKWCGAEEPVSAFFERSRYDELFPAGTPDREAIEATMRERLTGPADLRQALEAIVAGLDDAGRGNAAATCWVEKTPRHFFQTPLILDLFGPSVRIVCVDRDPRAILASRVRRWGGDPLEQVPRFARQWSTSDRMAGTFAQEHGEFIRVRYEDLVQDPEPVLRQVAGHLGVAWSDRLLTPTRAGVPWAGNSSYGSQSSGISKGSERRFVDELGNAVIAALERRIGPRMLRHGYEPVTNAASGFAWQRLLVETRSRLGAMRAARKARE